MGKMQELGGVEGIGEMRLMNTLLTIIPGKVELNMWAVASYVYGEQGRSR